MEPFELHSAPLAGKTLIEAGAGTGKTYTLTGLVLRLIVEQGVDIEQILVVTYTKAATEELKERIRSRLNAAKHAFSGKAVADGVVALLAQRTRNHQIARQRIVDALINFDRAAIFTIHGFCQRLLQQFAFETGHLFRSDLLQDRDHLIQEMAADFWRRYMTNAPYELARFALQELKGPDHLGRIITYCSYPDAKVLPEGVKPALRAIAPWRETAERLQRQWAQQSDSILNLLKDPGLHARYYGKCEPNPERMPHTFRQLRLLEFTACLDHWNGRYPLEEKQVKYLRASLLRKYTKKGHTAPEHPFFDTCDNALDAQSQMEKQMERYLRFLKIRLLQQSRPALERKKQRRNILFFDDLLLHVRSALRGRQGGALVRAVERQYRAALVDEFQDTDQVQYEIFQRLFDHPPMMLFMIGDPKQAIYSFRGADVFSYLRAADGADRSATLSRNWRSTPSLVEAVNSLFERHPYPFGFRQIRFYPAAAARRAESSIRFPLTIWHLTRTGGDAPSKPINQADAVGTIAAAVAEEVVRLLNSPRDKIEPRHMAVLTRTHIQSQIIKRALSKKQVPAVLHSAGSVFDTEQADGLLSVLLAAADPHDPGKVRAALAQDMFGWQAGDFHHAIKGAGERWQQHWANFYHDHRIWLRRGVYPMLRTLMAREKVRSRMLSRPDGERALTNILHLAELLHEAESEHGLGPDGVVNWLVEQRHTAQEGDERQLRLESDADAVRIITMHKSKGLQFDVVFCPFTWSGLRMDKEAVVFHDGADDNRLTLRLGPDIPIEDQLQAGKELLAENLRMLYVALTRARQRCYLVWGRVNGTELSAPAYLFHGQQTGGDQADWMAPLARRMKSITDAELIAELEQLCRQSKGGIRIVPLPQSTHQVFGHPITEKRPGRRRHLKRIIAGPWPMTSFSSLTAAAPDERNEAHDRDAAAGDAPSGDGVADAFDTLFNFPKGAHAGLFFHDLLEHWDHTGARPGQQEELIRSKLQIHGFDPRWHPTVDRFLGRLSTKRLSVPGMEFSLSQVRTDHRINEMEFYFPLKGFTSDQIKQCFKMRGDAMPGDAVETRLERISFAPENGVLKGFIDTVFQYRHQYFLVDWKSNHLGDHPELYDARILEERMVDDDYFLQYHLYTVALNRLLAQKVAGYRYERHFGGVFYIFLRGITAEPSERSGLFFHKPEGPLISALDDLMIKTG